jgi:hypothetical protein
MSSIVFDQNTYNNAGHVQLVDYPDPPADPAGPKKLSKADHDSLSFLVFYMTYTFEGRKLWKDNSPGYNPVDGNNLDPAVAKANLMAALLQQFPGVPALDREALIDSHIAGSLYVQAFRANPQTDQTRATMAAQEFIYKQKLAFICSELYEDSLGHDFSMSW